MSKKLVEVRSLLDKELDGLAEAGDSTREIATKFVDANDSTVAADLWREVKIIGVIQLLGDRRKLHRTLVGPPDAPDLFEGFNVGPSIVVVRSYEEGKGFVEKNKGIPSLTLPEALDFIERHSKERKADGKRISEWRRMVRRARPFMTNNEGMTLEEGLRAAAAAEVEKKKKKGS